MNVIEDGISPPLAIRLGCLFYTDEQKNWIRARDQDSCQAPVPHNCGGPLEVHHILPVARCKLLGIYPHTPHNGITLCHNFHHEIEHEEGKRHNPHCNLVLAPEGTEVTRTLNKTTAIDPYKPFWNIRFDDELFDTARRRTKEFEKEGGGKFPPNPYRKAYLHLKKHE